MPLVRERFKNAWHAFTGRDPTPTFDFQMGYATSFRPDRIQLSRSNLKSVVASVYNQIAVDCASVGIQHVRLDENDKYLETIHDSLNYALRKEANIDQTGRELVQDIVISLLDEGCVAVVPTVVDVNPKDTDSYKIYELRVGKILQWRPYEVFVELYNDLTGEKKQWWCEKRTTCIIENPFYSIMNEPNSTAKRLIRVLNQLDRTNEENSAGKLDLIVQLPYLIKGDARIKQAEKRRKDIEAQLTGSKYGIAYIDGTEKVIQLNRGVENNLWTQAKELQADLYNQLGFSASIFDGTADEQTMLNYNNRTIEPIMSAIVENMERKWISKTAQTQRQGIRFYKDPFKLVPVSQIAEIADKFTRNEIMTSNEVRSIVGMKPIDDPKADQLRNANLNHPDEEGTTSTVVDEVIKQDGFTGLHLSHVGKGHDDNPPGRGSGRYPYGSGERPFQNDKKITKYDPPMSKEEVIRIYGDKLAKRLANDPAHKFRMESGIELIHQEPDFQELERIWDNWNRMTDEQKMLSDSKSIELFGMNNREHYEWLLENIYKK